MPADWVQQLVNTQDQRLQMLTLQVDCVYFDEDMVEVAEDPVSDVREALSHCQLRGLEHACPQCLENQRRLVCAQLTFPS